MVITHSQIAEEANRAAVEGGQVPAGPPPPVVAVVVTHDAGSWFDEMLASLAHQDYPRLAVLVVDAASETDPEPAVRHWLPDAVVHHLDGNPGYGAAANVVLDEVEGAAFLLFLHDDVALRPDAVTLLVEESFRSNAGVCGTKMVDWNDPTHLREVGMLADKFGQPAPLVERDERDQEQHDRVRDVFYVTGGAVLVRADLFHTIGGFDEAITYLGDDLDLCWRAQMAGSRVLVVPDAVARHVEALGERRTVDDRRRLQQRHRVRTTLKCYSVFHLIRVVPQALVLLVAEAVYSTVVGRFSQAKDVVSAWTWNLGRWRQLRRARHAAQSVRTVDDGDLRRMQVRGSARMSAFFRGQIGGDARLQQLAARGRDLAGAFSDGPRRTVLATWGVIVLMFLLGSRQLITGGVPEFGQFQSLGSWTELRDGYWSGWQDIALGRTGIGPAALGLLTAGSTVLLGATSWLRAILIIGAVPLGMVGMWRLAAPFGSRRGRLAALVVYSVVALPPNVIALGDWDALAVVALYPWLLYRILRLSRLAPYGPVLGLPGPGFPDRSDLHQIVSLGLLVAAGVAFEPALALLVPATAVVVLVGAALTGTILPALRGLVATVAATLLGVALHFPRLLQVDDWRLLGDDVLGVPAGRRTGDLAALLRFDIGPWGAGPLSYAPLVIAGAALLVARSSRAGWAVRAWVLALCAWGVAWVAGNDWVSFDLPSTAVLLVPAATGLALASAVAAASAERDLAGRGFGAAQIAVGVAVLAAVAAFLPFAAAVIDGRWATPTDGWASALGFMAADRNSRDQRVVWIGDPEVLPATGWPLGDDLAVAVTGVEMPTVADHWVTQDDPAAEPILQAVRYGLEGDTARLGRLLAPFAVRYVVVLEQAAPSFADGLSRPVPPDVVQALQSQLDLRSVLTDPAAAVFENEGSPTRFHAVADDEATRELVATSDPAVLATRPSPASTPALTDGGDTHREGTGSGLLVVSDADGEGWTLRRDGETVPSEPAYGFARSYVLGARGELDYDFDRSTAQTALVVAQIVAWLVLLRIALAEPRQRGWSKRTLATATRYISAGDEP